LPLPDRRTFCGDRTALSLMKICPRIAPLRVGIKLALIVHCALGCNCGGHSSVINTAGLLEEIALIVRGTAFLLVSATDLLAVAGPPTVAVPKPSEPGLMLMAPCFPNPFKLTLTTLAALLDMSKIAFRERVPVGWKTIGTEHLPPGGITEQLFGCTVNCGGTLVSETKRASIVTGAFPATLKVTLFGFPGTPLGGNTICVPNDKVAGLAFRMLVTGVAGLVGV